MKTKLCLKCKNEFPAAIVIDGKRRNLQNRDFCLTCSPLFTHNTKDLRQHSPHLELPVVVLVDGIESKKCSCCKDVKPLGSFYKRKDSGEPHRYCKECILERSVKTQRKNKEKMVQYKGGKCLICGYDKYLGAIDFHHLDPSKKDREQSNFKNLTLASAKEELDKCVAVCRNCHSEIHGGVVNVNDFL